MDLGKNGDPPTAATCRGYATALDRGLLVLPKWGAVRQLFQRCHGHFDVAQVERFARFDGEIRPAAAVGGRGADFEVAEVARRFVPDGENAGAVGTFLISNAPFSSVTAM